MGKIDELVEEVKKAVSRVEVVEKTVTDMGKARGDATEILRKAMLDGRGGQNVVVTGGDGTPMSMLNVLSGGRQKSLGWGTFLQAVHAVATGKGADQASKALDKMGAKAINKVALAEGSGFTGGYTVPVQFHAELLRLVAEEAFVAQKCMTLPMQSRSLLVPTLNHSSTPAAGTSTFFGGVAASWTPEATSIPESEPTFRQKELVARDLAFHTIASNQLLADNAVALDTLLTTLFKEAMAWFKDFFILRGNGANQPLGVLTNPTNIDYDVSDDAETNPAAVAGPTITVERTTASKVALSDLARMLAHLLTNSWQNACWVINPSVIPQLIRLTNGATNAPFLVWLNPAPNSAEGPVAMKIPATLFGIPIFWSEKVPTLGGTGDVGLYDFSKYLLGDRMQLQIETSPHVRFLNNQMVWRIIMRWDGQPWPDAPLQLSADGALSTAFLSSPFVALGQAAAA